MTTTANGSYGAISVSENSRRKRQASFFVKTVEQFWQLLERFMAFKMNNPRTKVGVNGQVFDEIRRKRGDWKWPTARDDPRLDRDYTRNAQPVDLSRTHTWADALKKRGK